MKVLVTGATGFIGSELTRFLSSQGHSVRAMCRSKSNIDVLSNDSVQVCWGNVLDSSSVKKAVDGCDCVFHLAAYAKNWAKDSRTFFEVNVTGTKNVLDASRQAKVKKVVVTSSAVTFGPSNGVSVKESDKRTAEFFTEYERNKFYAEELVTDHAGNGLPVVIVNPTRVFGPGLLTEGNSATTMTQQYLEGKWRLILGDGSSVGNYASVEDVVRGHWLALLHGRPGEKYILGGENLSYNEFFRVLAKISRKRYQMIHVPVWAALAISNVVELRARWFGYYPLITPPWVRTFIADWAFSSEKAQRELGYTITPFRKVLQKTVLWLNQISNKSGR
ncbi:MAG: SDR family oxidoreductase [Candidatus Aminicenantes bacterium]|nr:MAG: SDR family oxidoreductase [Candidatus Aminicenantes bacterium]